MATKIIQFEELPKEMQEYVNQELSYTIANCFESKILKCEMFDSDDQSPNVLYRVFVEKFNGNSVGIIGGLVSTDNKITFTENWFADYDLRFFIENGTRFKK